MTTKKFGIKQSLSHTIEFSKNTHPPTPPTIPAGELQRAVAQSFGVRHPLRGNSSSLADPVPGRKSGLPNRAGRTNPAHPEPRCTNLCTPDQNQGDRREPRTHFRKPVTWTFIPARLPGACPCRSDSKKVTRSCRAEQIGRSHHPAIKVFAGRAISVRGADATERQNRRNCIDVICVIRAHFPVPSPGFGPA